MINYGYNFWEPNKFKTYYQFYKHKINLITNRGCSPDFIIAGVQKAGTTSLFRYLIQHKSIDKSLKKEVHYFDRNSIKSKNWYYAFFVKKNNKNLIGEATPGYFYLPQTPKLIKAIVPEAKIIVLVRNPIDRAISHYKMMYRRNIESENDIIKAFKRDIKDFGRDLELLEEDPMYKSKTIDKFGYLYRGCYDLILESWLKYYDLNDIKFVKAEDLFTKPLDAIYEVLDFLNLEKFTPNDLRNFNPSGSENKIDDIEVIDFLKSYYLSHVTNFEEMVGKNFNWKYFD